jgi:hypothetical protein
MVRVVDDSKHLQRPENELEVNFIEPIKQFVGVSYQL